MDYFNALNEPRRPWLDEQLLKTKFLELSARVHPDRAHGGGEDQKARAHERYAELNVAYNCLREPKERLLHLLELELGARPSDVRQIPPDVMSLFVEANQTLRQADVFLQTRGKSASALTKARMFEEGMELTGKLQTLGQTIQSRRDILLGELKTMNETWESAPAPGSAGRGAALPLERLEEIYRDLSYFSRWAGQIQERALQISFR